MAHKSPRLSTALAAVFSETGAMDVRYGSTETDSSIYRLSRIVAGWV